jgi:hypothetical protein
MGSIGRSSKTTSAGISFLMHTRNQWLWNGSYDMYDLPSFIERERVDDIVMVEAFQWNLVWSINNCCKFVKFSLTLRYHWRGENSQDTKEMSEHDRVQRSFGFRTQDEVSRELKRAVQCKNDGKTGDTRAEEREQRMRRERLSRARRWVIHSIFDVR